MPDAELMAHVRTVAARLDASAPLTLRAIKDNSIRGRKVRRQSSDVT